MEKSQGSKISKLVKGLRGTLNRQKTIGKGRAPTLSDQSVIYPPEAVRSPRERLPLPLPPSPMVDAICQLPYYHPHLTSKDDLTNFMSQYSLQDGYFLLRKSFKDPTSYIITVNHLCGLKHILVVISNGRYSLKDRSFDTIDEMIQFYSHHEIPNEQKISGILLRFPIRRPPIEFGEYIVVAKHDSSPYLEATGRQGSAEDRHQPPKPRAPAALPRDPDTPRKGSSIDQTHIPPSVEPSSSINQNPSMNMVNTIRPPQKNDPKTTMSIYPTLQRLALYDMPQDTDENERCDCGLLMREASLPLGWSVHVSHDSDTKNQLFFLSPNNETNWELPFSVALHLSPEQQDFIRNLKFDSDIKAAGPKPGRPITRSKGCSMKTKRLQGTMPAKNTWVSCDDYESSKSLREALERQGNSLDGVQSKNAKSSEHTPNGELQHPKPTAGKEGRSRTKTIDDQTSTVA